MGRSSGPSTVVKARPSITVTRSLATPRVVERGAAQKNGSGGATSASREPRPTASWSGPSLSPRRRQSAMTGWATASLRLRARSPSCANRPREACAGVHSQAICRLQACLQVLYFSFSLHPLLQTSIGNPVGFLSSLCVCVCVCVCMWVCVGVCPLFLFRDRAARGEG